MKISLVLLAFLFMKTGLMNAHALYIDTDTQGELNKNHEVRIYYSEFQDRSLEQVADWYSDVADFDLWLVQPNGERIELETTAGKDHYSANFSPEMEGNYRLEISHLAAAPASGTAYQFNAFAQVSVGDNEKLLPITAEGPELLVLEENKGSGDSEKGVFRTYFKGEPAGGITATLFLPSGETLEIKSDSDGIMKLPLEETGIYFLEATTYHEDEAGNTGKAEYEAVWRCATQKIIRS